ncbi:MlaA family lipoprotein [Roseicella frigidaeris]|uniref:VacJ family lipoprotein n=1 Tax=Roseicella frigidaeris TaxID=2230885 RepID=A0A327MA53_9PROT|nr:VacJ family lipoprotein [Roseicella frigidaeris]RAI59639.1 VacJ family lipoprotein [Roseicella frigidaeris]
MTPPPAALLSLALLLAGCAQQAGPRHQADRPQQVAQASETPPVIVTDRPIDPADPFEATNRRILAFNFTMDDALFKPIAEGYRAVLGPWPRARIHNVLENINEPVVTANRLLQGKPIEAGTSFMRFVINTTLGLGGLFDLAPIGGPPKQLADFGQTLANWGLPDGPYLMVPMIGPSTPRDFAGMVADGFINPLSYTMPVGANLGRTGMEGLDQRERSIEALDELRSGSLDVYARLRSLWRQNRDAELGRESEPDLLEDPGAPAPGPIRRPSVTRPGVTPQPRQGLAPQAKRAPARPVAKQVAKAAKPRQGRGVALHKAAKPTRMAAGQARPGA